MTTLPTPRALLTTILNTLPSTPITANPLSDSPNQQQIVNPPYDPPSNPLKPLPASYRALLTTLHVLLPTGVLLQALDLLDRGLVVRVIEENPTLQSTRNDDREMVMPPQTYVHLLDPLPSDQSQLPLIAEPDLQNQSHVQEPEVAQLGEDSKPEPTNKTEKTQKTQKIYQVRSSQVPKSRFRDSMGSMSSTSVYTVRVEAWNCSCAAFAFEAFPGGSLMRAPWASLDEEGSGEAEISTLDQNGNGWEETGTREEKWEFGGLSCDWRGEGRMPICKHLLACVLAERWEGVLGSYVRERDVGREEMAGVGGEG